MAKRKRNVGLTEPTISGNDKSNKKVKTAPKARPASEVPTANGKEVHNDDTVKNTVIQIVAGSYDRVLHGLYATVSPSAVDFADTFLFDAHTSAIRCLAISPPSAPIPKQTQKVILASGSTDQRINLYHLSAHAPRVSSSSQTHSLLNNGRKVVENAQNKELGSLLHHASSVTSLYFPTRSKLLSSAEDSTIAVTRTRDWSLLSTIKAPVPKPIGRPSGDTAPLGGTPAGVNDFAVHPSMKLMVTVGKGEKSMRLWNLVTGKKAGVLTFGRKELQEVGEGRFASGEGRKVAWGHTKDGDEFCIGFDRGILVFGMDSKPRCKVVSSPKSKMHQLYYLPSEVAEQAVLAVSTEDGRILFYSTAEEDLVVDSSDEHALSSAKLIAQLGGRESKVTGRIKDFKTLKTEDGKYIIITANSDGRVSVWSLAGPDLEPHKAAEAKQVGSLLGSYETGNRVTCLEAFIMLPSQDGPIAVERDDGKEDTSSSESD